MPLGKHRRNFGWLAAAPPWAAAPVLVAAMVLALSSCRVRREPPPAESESHPPPPAESVAAEPPSALPVVEPPPPEPVVVPEGAAMAAISGSPNQPEAAHALLAGLGRVSDSSMQASALDAVAEAVIALEQSGRLPAGLGAAPRGDGVRLLDAVLMDQEGVFSGVAGVSRLATPMKAARSVAELRSALLVGDGAIRFAESVGIELLPAPPRMVAPPVKPAAEDAVGGAGGRGDRDAGGFGGASGVSSDAVDAGTSASADLLADAGAVVDADGLSPSIVDGGAPVGDAAAAPPSAPSWLGDGVAAVVRTADGRFAVAASAGGIEGSLPGEISWISAPGRGIYVSPKGAVAVVGGGLGPDPIARRVHDRMVAIGSPQEAARWALSTAPDGAVIGIVAIDARTVGIATRPELSWVERSAKGDRTSAPSPEVAP